MLYVHIPFCRKACHYCDFHFSTQLGGIEAMVNAIAEEGQLWADDWPLKGPMQTLYFGGGTPSLVMPTQLERLIERLGSVYNFSALQECTLEANPEDITSAAVQAWQTMGITRISLGVQTLDDALLPKLNRGHTAAQALQAVATLQAGGMAEISIDLIFGLPGQTFSGFQADVEKMVALGVPHISLYGLTIEDRTAFGRWVAKGQMNLPEEGLLADMMAWLQDRLAKAGYDGYEISNYAKLGHEAKHNSAYWEGVPYLGLGPSAHSFDGTSRWHNVANNSQYTKLIAEGKRPQVAQEALAGSDLFNERLLTGLRLAKGFDYALVSQQIGINWPTENQQKVQEFTREGYLLDQQERLILTPKGRLLADFITQKLML